MGILNPVLLQVGSLICSVAVATFAVFRLIGLGGFNVTVLVVSLFQLLSGVLLFVADFRALEVFGYIKFIYTATGRGGLMVLLGALCLGRSPWEIIVGVALMFIGVLFFLFACVTKGVPKPILQRNELTITLGGDVYFVDSSGAQTATVGGAPAAGGVGHTAF
ncbi:unnamed protein product [Vitrella brassicaformis CCMP3155]|uniref:COPI associated protein n=1 Tax=Vitrella brassicaformis (strain CCMP3155) TaxID=1169540 RepID=A0A0G4F6W1_VITBC|nr:unnamed protein product [Vitrella brassicaformis CCMP3155]|eukprot:CEM07864.1 unnamed protein product [Vitrella brassicaformis CCMP3155]